MYPDHPFFKMGHSIVNEQQNILLAMKGNQATSTKGSSYNKFI